jgi:hypothetical protein
MSRFSGGLKISLGVAALLASCEPEDCSSIDPGRGLTVELAGVDDTPLAEGDYAATFEVDGVTVAAELRVDATGALDCHTCSDSAPLAGGGTLRLAPSSRARSVQLFIDAGTRGIIGPEEVAVAVSLDGIPVAAVELTPTYEEEAVSGACGPTVEVAREIVTIDASTCTANRWLEGLTLTLVAPGGAPLAEADRQLELSLDVDGVAATVSLPAQTHQVIAVDEHRDLVIAAGGAQLQLYYVAPHLAGGPAVTRVHVFRHATPIAEGSFEPEYTRVAPNGARCGIATTASAALEVPAPQ